MSRSGGDQYIHNRKENSSRQRVLQECFRDTSADAFRRSGIAAAAAAGSSGANYKILEIGCGAGLTTIDIAHQLDDKANITAIDANANLIANARGRLERSENAAVHSRIQFYNENGESAADRWRGQFDAVWMRFVVVHVPDPTKIIQVATACLKPNGILLVEECNMEGHFSDPPLYACNLLHDAHIRVSLELGGDMRRGPLIGSFMKQVGLKDIQCNVFSPIFGKGVTVQPWNGNSNDQSRDDAQSRFELGFELLRQSLDSLTPMFLEYKVCGTTDIERAKSSLDEVKGRNFQLFTIPGGQIYQWWAHKASSTNFQRQGIREAKMKPERTGMADEKRLQDIVDMERHPLESEDFRETCRRTLDNDGVLVMHDFLKGSAIEAIRRDAVENEHLAFYTSTGHNIYLLPPDDSFPGNHPRNRMVSSSKGCIQTDQIPRESALHGLYESRRFREFLCAVLGEKELHEYADPLSSINIHYASKGQELNWHFDNSSFAITLLIQKPESGGEFEYVRDVRDSDAGDMNYKFVGDILDGIVPTKKLEMHPGTLVLFRGRNSMHRVTPVQLDRKRLLVVLAYNTEPGISLSESARMTFFGRLS